MGFGVTSIQGRDAPGFDNFQYVTYEAVTQILNASNGNVSAFNSQTRAY